MHSELSFQANHLAALQLISTTLVVVSFLEHVAPIMRLRTNILPHIVDLGVHHIDVEEDIDQLPAEIQVGAQP